MAIGKKQYAVIGLGRFGTSVAVTLHSLGHEVLAIDSDEERVQKLSEEVTHVVQADTTDENSLHALGLRNFDAVGSAARLELKSARLHAPVHILVQERQLAHLDFNGDLPPLSLRDGYPRKADQLHLRAHH